MCGREGWKEGWKYSSPLTESLVQAAILQEEGESNSNPICLEWLFRVTAQTEIFSYVVSLLAVKNVSAERRGVSSGKKNAIAFCPGGNLPKYFCAFLSYP